MSRRNRGWTATSVHRVALATRAVRSRSIDDDRNRSSSGFTLIEALVALALVLAFAAALGRLLFQAHRIMLTADGQVAAQVLLRSLLDTPVDRTSLASASHDGETQGLRWRVVAVPMDVDAWLPPLPPPSPSPSPSPLPGASSSPRPDHVNWAAFRVVASVSLPSGQVITGETVRLGKVE
jgi:prepilin-type N-terminal cleavage/methylation domain-containing protein